MYWFFVHFRGVLARETGVVGPRVGKYSVNVTDIDRIALPCLDVGEIATNGKTSSFVIIDEIGKIVLLPIY